MSNERFAIQSICPTNDFQRERIAWESMKRQMGDQIMAYLTTGDNFAIKIIKSEEPEYNSDLPMKKLRLDLEVAIIPTMEYRMPSYKELSIGELSLTAIDEIKSRIKRKIRRIFGR